MMTNGRMRLNMSKGLVKRCLEIMDVVTGRQGNVWIHHGKTTQVEVGN